MKSHCYINACPVSVYISVRVSGNPWAFWTWADLYNTGWLITNHSICHAVKYSEVKGQSGEWLIRSHSEGMNVFFFKTKPWNPPPHGLEHTVVPQTPFLCPRPPCLCFLLPAGWTLHRIYDFDGRAVNVFCLSFHLLSLRLCFTEKEFKCSTVVV